MENVIGKLLELVTGYVHFQVLIIVERVNFYFCFESDGKIDFGALTLMEKTSTSLSVSRQIYTRALLEFFEAVVDENLIEITST